MGREIVRELEGEELNPGPSALMEDAQGHLAISCRDLLQGLAKTWQDSLARILPGHLAISCRDPLKELARTL